MEVHIKALEYRYRIKSISDLPCKLNLDGSCQAKDKKRKRVLWIGINQSQDCGGFTQALSEVFDLTIFCDDTTWGVRNGIGTIDLAVVQKIEKTVREKNIDIVFMQCYRYMFDKKSLQRFRHLKCKKINISMDDILPSLISLITPRQSKGALGLAHIFDVNLITTYQYIGLYKKINDKSYFFPLASSPEIMGGNMHCKRTLDVLFIGNNYGARGAIIDYLRNNGIYIECWGDGFTNGFIDSEKVANLASKAKIQLGIGYVGHSQRVTNPKLRDFDAIASGALYVTTYDPQIASLFENEKDALFYRSKEELLSIISYYLAHNNEREIIAECGLAKLSEFHTWDVRFNFLKSLL